MSRKLRLTQIVFDLNGGGMETLVAEMAARWQGSDITMSVITLSGRVGRVGESVRRIVDQYHVLKLTPGLSMLAPIALVRAIRATRPDVVHLHSGAWYKGALAARLARVPRIIFTEHGREHDDPALVRWLDRRAGAWTSTVVAVSERLHEYLVRVVGISKERVVTVPNGVDTAIFTPGPASAEIKRSLGLPADALVLGSVGRLEPVKAYSRLVEAYAQLRGENHGPPLVLVIYGEGTDRPTVEATVDRLGLKDHVRLPGWTTSPADGYRLLDVFAMTSRSEGMSVSLMEAMSCGCCPVVTNVGSNAEVLGPELESQVIADGDGEALLRALREVLASKARRAELGGLARLHAEQAHSLSRMLADYERLYRGEPVTGTPA
ncbi:MAG TPA: glycosyltransferase [Gemmatimonadales bacterium]